MTGTGADSRETVLQLVVFSAAGYTFGADAEQIAGIREPGGSSVDLVVRGNARHPIAVDRIEEITEIGIGAIRPFPPLVAPYVRLKGMWGVVSWKERIVFLIDFGKMREPPFYADGTRGPHKESYDRFFASCPSRLRD